MDLDDFHEVNIEEIMDDRTWDLPLIEHNASIKMAMILLTGRGYGWVVRGKRSMELVGVITEHDALSLLRGERKQEVKKVEELMTPNPITCRKDEKVKEILKKMKKYGVRRLAVVDGKKIVGEINLRHLIEKYYSLFLFRK
ncbi:MAG: CBS domain-containing protein [Thermoplasmata archaeon]|nr:MAG: CBS domain-containing protein [Thermoplasmata archaeon]